MIGSGKHSSLLRCAVNYGHKKFYVRTCLKLSARYQVGGVDKNSNQVYNFRLGSFAKQNVKSMRSLTAASNLENSVQVWSSWLTFVDAARARRCCCYSGDVINRLARHSISRNGTDQKNKYFQTQILKQTSNFHFSFCIILTIFMDVLYKNIVQYQL